MSKEPSKTDEFPLTRSGRILIGYTEVIQEKQINWGL